MNVKRLLLLDSIVDIILGMLLLLYRTRLGHFLGLPIPESAFYPSILGGVLIGIGLALLIEVFNKANCPSGLGIRGAIVINLCGAGTLMFWMVFGNLEIPHKEYLSLVCSHPGFLDRHIGMGSLE